MVRKHIEKIPARREDSHKGDYGRVFVIAGSVGMTGAAFLCCRGALRAGSGLVINGIPGSLNEIMEVKLTEAMTMPLAETRKRSLSRKAGKRILEFSRKCDAVVIGPGLGDAVETRALVKELVKKIKCPVVLDADGINALKGNKGLLRKRKHRTVITPHPGELARLIKKDTSSLQAQRTEIATRLAEDTGTIVCLKGHRTVVADPAGQVYVNVTGNSGMATAGTGDVLTGMIASFIGQGVDDFSSAVSAVYLHGLAGDIAAEKMGQFSMTATDILEYLPRAFDRAGIF